MSDSEADLNDPLDLGWFDPDDPFLYERSYPRGFCFTCGDVAGSTAEERTHAATCSDPRESYRPWHCWRCATENWRRTVCRCCGWERPEEETP